MSRRRWDEGGEKPLNNPINLAEFRKKRKAVSKSLTIPIKTGNSSARGRFDENPPDKPVIGPDLPGETLAPSIPQKALVLIRKWRKGGMKHHDTIVVTDELKEQVAMMAVSGASQDNIAKCLGISTPTLRKYFGDELECVPVIQNALVANTALTMAISGNSVAATAFWLKARAGWRDIPEGPLPGSQGSVNVVIHIGGVDADL